MRVRALCQFLEDRNIAVDYPEAETALERGEERNMRRFTLLALAVAAAAIIGGGAQTATAARAVAAPWNNCTQVHTSTGTGWVGLVRGTGCAGARPRDDVQAEHAYTTSQ